MTPERLRALLADVASGAAAPWKTRSGGWPGRPWKTWTSPGWTTTARCGRAFPRSSLARARRRSRSWPSASASPRGATASSPRAWRAEAHELLRSALPAIEINLLGRTAWLPATHPAPRKTRGTVLIVTAGTSDLPVAEEAAVTAAAFGNPVARLTDVGVAGIHRLLAARDTLARRVGGHRGRGDGGRAARPSSAASWPSP